MTKFKTWIEAPNSSHGFHYQLFNYIDKYSKENDILLLVSEPVEVVSVFNKEFPLLSTTVLGYSGERGETFYDFNIIREPSITYDIILSQATLEHVCRPSIFVENLVNWTKVGGHVILHTHNPRMAEHKWPYDCVRFLKDFFFQLEKYIPAKVVGYEEEDVHIFVVYERV